MDKVAQRKRELVEIIEAIGVVLKSRDWQTIEELMFDPLTERIERDLLAEAKKPVVEPEKIYVLQGKLAHAKRYDLENLSETLKNELQGLELRKNNDNITEGPETN